MSAIDRELLVMRGFAASRGDDDAIDEAQRDVELMRVQIAALEARVATLRAALEVAANDLLSAADDVESWGAYASECFQRRHNLPREIAHIKECAEGARKALEATK